MPRPPDRRAAFLDRDGVIVAEAPPEAPPKHLELLGGAAGAIARLNRDGWLVVVVTNQPAVARGLRTESEIGRQHDDLATTLAALGARIDAFYFCPHHPDATVPTYRTRCECRKPGPGMLTDAARDLGIDLPSSVMIGDRMTDIEAGVRAGCGLTVLVSQPRDLGPRIASHLPVLDAEPDLRVDTLVQGADLLVGSSSRSTTP